MTSPKGWTHFRGSEMTSPEGWIHFQSLEMTTPEGWTPFQSLEMTSPEGWIHFRGSGGHLHFGMIPIRASVKDGLRQDVYAVCVSGGATAPRVCLF